MNRLGYKLISPRVGAQYDFLRKSKPPSIFHTLYNENYDKSITLSESLYDDVVKILMEDGKMVFFGSIDGFSKEQIAHLFPLNVEDKLTGPIGFALTKDSELTEMFNYHLLHLTQTGMMRKFNLNNLMWSEREMSQRSGEMEEVKLLEVGFGNVVFPFLAVAFGIAMACILTIFEFLAFTKSISIRKPLE